MARLTISNFRYGLDTRRSEIEQQPGTLEVGHNGHVNQGGEFEKREKFALQSGTLSAEGFATYGLEVVSSGFVVFGSDAEPETSPFPAGVSYQRLQHPDGSQAMTAVLHSETFGNKCFVIAQFADDSVFAFYDGTIVSDFVSGLVLPGATDLDEIAVRFADLFDNVEGFTAETPVGAADDQVNIEGTYGFPFVLDPFETSDAGTVTASNRSAEVPASGGATATATFRIIAGSDDAGVNRVYNILAGADAGTLVSLIGSPVNWAGSNSATAAAIAAEINGHTSDPDYTATSSNDVVTVIAAPGDEENAFILRVISEGDVCVDQCGFTVPDAVTQLDTLSDGSQSLITGAPIVRGVLTLAAFCEAIASNIRAGGETHGYTAYAGGDGFYVSRLTTNSNDGDLTITAESTGADLTDGTPEPPPDTLAANLSVSTMWATKYASAPSGTYAVSTLNDNSAGYQKYCNCYASEGTSPYTYLWEEASSGSGNGIVIGTPTAPSTAFFANLTLDEAGEAQVSGTFKCTVTDSASGTPGTATTSIVTVTLNAVYPV